MSKIGDQLKEVLLANPRNNSKFQNQLDTYRKFSETMREAGVHYGDKYEMPLMIRSGLAVGVYRQNSK